jgi:type IX secretion system PorP/SprF family membrane protein
MIKYLLVFIAVLFSAKASAQQSAIYAQYMFNGLAINPAYAGSHDALSTSFLTRYQNYGLKGAPQTQTFSVHSPLLNRRVALGFLVVNDKVSIFEQTGINFSYAYRIPVTQKSVLSFGLQAGAIWYKADYNSLALLQNPDPNFSQNVVETRPNFGAGVYYYSKLGYVSFSMPHLLNNVLKTNGGQLTIHQSVPFILTGGYVFTLNRVLKLKPNFLFEVVDGRPVEFDLNANMLFDEVLWFGVSYKTSNAVAFLTELQINDQFRFGYSYLFNTGPIRNVQIGTQEIMLNYRFKYHKKGIVTPRYF